MSRSLRVLILTDRSDDARLMIEELDRSGFSADWRRVETREEYLAHLGSDIDAILVGHTLPQFDAVQALQLVRERPQGIPFIVVGGDSDAGSAGDSLRREADGYVFRDQLGRLGPMVTYVVEAKRRRDRCSAGASEERLSARQWQAAFDAIGDPVFLVDAGGRIVRCNSAALDIVGQPREELIRLQMETVKRVLATGEPETVEYPLETVDGTRRFLARVNPVPVVEGRPRTVLWLARDITERKRAEEKGRESQRRLLQIIEGAPTPAFVINADHVVTHWNEACELLTDMPSEDVIGTRNHWKPFYDEERPLLADLVLDGASEAELTRHYGDQCEQSALIEGAYEAEGFYRGLGEGGRWLLLSAAPLRDLDGQLIGAVEVLRDITDRKRIEKALEQRVAELMLLNEIGNKITRNLGVQTMLQSAVEIVRRSFGYQSVAILSLDSERGELVTKAIAGHFAGVGDQHVGMDLNEGLIGWAARHGETALANDVAADPRYLTRFPDGVSIRSELAVPIHTAGGVVGVLDVQSEHLGAFGVNDVLVMETLADQIAVALENARLYEAEQGAREELRDLTSYLQDAREKERTRIAREIHDEFGQMLTALKMDLSWLSKRLPEDEPRLREKALAMSDVIDRSFEIVRRVSSELRPGILDDLGLAAAIEWQAEDYAKRGGIALELHLDEAAGMLNRDLSTALFRILQEALTNIGRHADATVARIELEVDPERVTLIVADNGRGIAPEDVSGRESLGLIGMRERARALGGEVVVEGVPDQGTTVTASIPRRHLGSGEPTSGRTMGEGP